MPGRAVDRMDEEFLIEALRLMLLSRQYDERVIGLQRQGRFSVYSPGLGQEAAIVGSAWDERQHSVSAKTYVADAALPRLLRPRQLRSRSRE
jgi:TPP-dependent pyruvate/acetoin dehydrogenase alpha subunit